jgi:DnaJ-class molecular chaperone
MKSNDDFKEVDSIITQEIMKEFKGEIISTSCPTCRGEGVTSGLNNGHLNPCSDCLGSGFIDYEY